MQDSAALLPSTSARTRASRGFQGEGLLAPEQALAAFFASVSMAPPPSEAVELEAAFGRVLARDVRARDDHPAQPRSTMDGYAVRSDGCDGTLRVVGAVFAGGAVARPLGHGEALRIATGGALPPNADAVVPQEDVELQRGGLVLRNRPVPGDCITQRGEDMRAGEVVLTAGRRIGAPELGLLATLGETKISVCRKPRIGIVSTGDEIVPPHGTLPPGGVRDSNRYAVAATLAALGADPVQRPHAPDSLSALHSIAGEAIADCDALVLTGGSSVGERDFVPRAVEALGPPGIIVHGLRVKPGKPTLLGAAAAKPIIGLPGNPASALIILEAVVRPIVLALTGETVRPSIFLEARASEPFAARAGWTWFVPVRLCISGESLVATPLRIRSGHASLLARAAGYSRVGETQTRIERGERVPVYRFSAGGALLEVA